MFLKISLSVVLTLVITELIEFSSALIFESPFKGKENDNAFWYSMGMEEIQKALKISQNKNIAKNIIFFLGDGMGVTTSTAGRIYKGQSKGYAGEGDCLSWENFPNVALIKTFGLGLVHCHSILAIGSSYCDAVAVLTQWIPISMNQWKTYAVDRQVTESSAGATASFGGVKVNYNTVGVNGNVAYKNCTASLNLKNRVDSILKWSQESGRETGFITTTRLTHGTPASLYAHSGSRDWECDSALEKDIGKSDCKDIARQFVEESPGKNINVILAGGRDPMGVTLESDGKSSCERTDKRNLVKEWQAQKEAAGNSSVYVTNNSEFKNIDTKKEDYILGLFSGSHMPYSYYRDPSPKGTPSLEEMTKVAIKRLKRSSNGFFLMVEGGRIDQALHDSKPRLALDDLLDFDKAVTAAINMTDTSDTLIIVAADHSHVMTMNGYPTRGNDILGTTTYEDVTDGLPYTTLMFTNGPGANFTWNGKEVVRRNLTGVDTRDPEFISQSAVPTLLGSETHGGEDIALYASGPMAHLFHSLHDNTYIAHALAYASCVGPFASKCDRASRVKKGTRR